MCVALSIIATTLAFWFFGGEHYLANHGDIDYRFFHHPEDETDALTCFFTCLKRDLPAFVVLIACSTALVVLKKQS